MNLSRGLVTFLVLGISATAAEWVGIKPAAWFDESGKVVEKTPAGYRFEAIPAYVIATITRESNGKILKTDASSFIKIEDGPQELYKLKTARNRLALSLENAKVRLDTAQAQRADILSNKSLTPKDRAAKVAAADIQRKQCEDDIEIRKHDLATLDETIQILSRVLKP